MFSTKLFQRLMSWMVFLMAMNKVTFLKLLTIKNFIHFGWFIFGYVLPIGMLIWALIWVHSSLENVIAFNDGPPQQLIHQKLNLLQIGTMWISGVFIIPTAYFGTIALPLIFGVDRQNSNLKNYKILSINVVDYFGLNLLVHTIQNLICLMIMAIITGCELKQIENNFSITIPNLNGVIVGMFFISWFILYFIYG